MFVATFRTTAAPHAIMERKGLFVATVLKSLLTACRKEVKAESPLQLTGAYRLERATLAYRLAARGQQREASKPSQAVGSVPS